MTLLDAARSLLLVVDVQERLLPAMNDGDAMISRAGVLLRGAGAFGIPVAFTEQYRKGLGATVATLGELAGDAPRFEKLSFSAWRDLGFRTHLEQIRDGGRNQIVITGIETHICVLQTSMELAAAGFETFVAADAVASRRQSDRERGLDRADRGGVSVVTSEMVLFEWAERAGTPAFKAISPLVRDL